MLPKIRFTESDFPCPDREPFEAACDRFIEKHQLRTRRAYAVTITGLWGAFTGIAAAKDFALATLLNTRYTLDNLYSIATAVDRRKLTIGVHVRQGDFLAPTMSEVNMLSVGMSNIRLPQSWYLNVRRALEAEFGESALQFLVCSDGAEAEVAGLLGEGDAIFCSKAANSDISDLLALSNCDLLICSTSTYSAWAAFLSNSPYIWYGKRAPTGWIAPAVEQLGKLGVRMPEFGDSGEAGRGRIVGGDGALPETLKERLGVRLDEKRSGR